MFGEKQYILYKRQEVVFVVCLVLLLRVFVAKCRETLGLRFIKETNLPVADELSLKTF